MLNGGTYVVEW